LSVSPASASLAVCLTPQTASFTVANTGGTTMAWSASTRSNGYVITPGSGTIAAGGSQTVSVSKITQSGSVTFTAPNAGNSPQQVTITCTLL
jgi:hypothetical protein